MIITPHMTPPNKYACWRSSRSEESFKQYFSEMPWLAVPYSDEARRSRLNRLYGIQGNCFFSVTSHIHLCNDSKDYSNSDIQEERETKNSVYCFHKLGYVMH